MEIGKKRPLGVVHRWNRCNALIPFSSGLAMESVT